MPEHKFPTPTSGFSLTIDPIFSPFLRAVLLKNGRASDKLKFSRVFSYMLPNNLDVWLLRMRNDDQAAIETQAAHQ